MRSILVIGLAAVAPLILGTRLSSSWLSLGSNLSLCMVLLCSLRGSRVQTLAIAMVYGLCVDLSSACVTGTHVLGFSLLGWFAWEACQVLLLDKWSVQMLLAGSATITCSFLVAFLGCLSDRPIVPPRILWITALMEGLWNAALLPILARVWQPLKSVSPAPLKGHI